jgi:hypothetical protein
MQLLKSRWGRIGLLAVCPLVLAACAVGAPDDLPDLAPVTGKVTLDGKPLANVAIKFEPQGKGAASNGATDAEGKYELFYVGEKKGAAVGAHIVRITVENEADATESVPSKYNTESELKANVEKGKPNEINFDLTK